MLADDVCQTSPPFPLSQRRATQEYRWPGGGGEEESGEFLEPGKCEG